MIKRYIEPDRSLWRELVTRVTTDDESIKARVESILYKVRTGGDAALLSIIEEIEKVRPKDGIEVSAEEVKEAESLVPQNLKDAITEASANITAFHKAQKFKTVEVTTVEGVRCIQRAVPLDTVGLYVPGGSAPLFSTVLMLAIPAKVAGCRETVLCTPCSRDGKVAPAVLYAAYVCGVDRIFKVGGAQAVAAMAYGTESIPKVDKIFGPGNRYVTKAKELVAGKVAIDMPAGPSEVLVMADRSAVPEFVAADLLSQAEHGADSQALLVCGSTELADEVMSHLSVQLESLPRKDIAVKALDNSRVIVLPRLEDQVAFVNMYAPEHLIISMSDPWKVAEKITAAGSVFLGNWSPESAGDYASGTNHTLPTSGWARSMSGVNLDSFVRKITYQEITQEGISNLGDVIVTMARAEGLDAHANAALVRMNRR